MEELLKQLIEQMNARFEQMEKRFDQIELRLEKMEEKIDHNHLEVRSDIRNVQNRLDMQQNVISLLSERSIEQEALIKKKQ